MKYKVGDKVLIKTWDELVDEFGIEDGDICITKDITYWWRSNDELLPKNRMVTIISLGKFNDYFFICEDGDKCFIIDEIIKCCINEYYLQQIKEELCQN